MNTTGESKFEETLKKAEKNIDKDRLLANTMINSLLEYVGENNERYQVVGVVIGKYMDNLQKSNEQLIKVASLREKQVVEVEEEELSEEEIYSALDKQKKD